MAKDETELADEIYLQQQIIRACFKKWQWTQDKNPCSFLQIDEPILSRAYQEKEALFPQAKYLKVHTFEELAELRTFSLKGPGEFQDLPFDTEPFFGNVSGGF
jgi:hypothetical protein